jgi:VWFA-related protein
MTRAAPRSCEKIGWQAKAPAPQACKSFDGKVGQTLSSVRPTALPIYLQLLTIVLVPAALGQQQKAEDAGAVFRAETRLVVCHTTVTDKEGHLNTSLPEEAFKVFEDGVPQEIKVFKREDIPVSIGLIIDNSGSMRDKRARVEAAALALVKDSNPEDEVFIVNFNDEAFLVTPPGKNFTSDAKELERLLKSIDSRGGTAMRDAIRMAIDYVKSKGRKDKLVLVVVTDGNDNESLITLDNLVRAAQQSDVLIYCVGLLGEEPPSEAAKARRALNELAVATGGETFFPTDVSEVDRIAHQVARDVRNQYTIEYTPSNAAMDGSYRQIKITVDAPGNPIVRTRSGYWAASDRSSPARPRSGR